MTTSTRLLLVTLILLGYIALRTLENRHGIDSSGPFSYGAKPGATAALQPFSGPVDHPARIAAAAPHVLDLPALYLAFQKIETLPAPHTVQRPEAQPGDFEAFWVSDTPDDQPTLITATLRYAGEIVLMYVDESLIVERQILDQAARDFEEHIYLLTRSLFGSEAVPGIDGDARLTILHTTLAGAGGYYSGADALPAAINRYSNERDMFVINVESYPVGSDAYLATLAHELQHMIHAHQQPHAATWFNEALAGLSQDLNGYGDDSLALIHLANPDVRLLGWSADAALSGEHYGTGQLFMRYFHEQYLAEGDLLRLMRADAGDNLDAFVQIASRKRPDIDSFATLFADWTVANVVNDPQLAGGRYAYSGLPDYVTLQSASEGRQRTSVNQFGADYLGILEGPLTVSFDGADSVRLTATQPEQGEWMWWSGRGDNQVSTLTAAFNLRDVDQATLTFSTWYAIERHFDYAYVTASLDNGATWIPLAGQSTTQDDPQGQNLGHGLTGLSGRPGVDVHDGAPAIWVDEQMDLTPFTGHEILLRFWLVNDAGLNETGLLVDNIRIPEIGYTGNAEVGDDGWVAEGFVRTSGGLPQTWAVRLVWTADGESMNVEEVPLDGDNRGAVHLDSGERGLLVVAATTPFTGEVATYEVEVSAARR